MRGTTWTRLALAGGASAACLLVAAPLASAETTSPAPVAPITLSPQESQQVCSDWVPKL